MKPQATRYTQKQLAYLAYWEQRGFTFRRGAVVPESTEIAPPSWDRPRPIELVATAALLIAIFVWKAL